MEDHSKGPQSSDPPTLGGEASEGTRKRLPRVAGITALVVAIAAGAAFLGSAGSAGDPNSAGSLAWCQVRGLSEHDCEAVNILAEIRGESPTQVLDDLLEETHPEGSYEWCSARGLTRTECNDVNELARQFGETPTEIYEQLSRTVDIINNG